jgi:GDPmannose 4,6-dehydratase
MFQDNKKVLITGISGMDGSNMADYVLANTNYTVLGMIRRTAKPDYSNIAKAKDNPRFKLVVGDLGDSQSIDNLVKEHKPDYFINFAAQSFVGSSWQIPEQTFDAGAVGVLRCLESIRKHAPYCRFYNAGSSEEFGDTLCAPQDETHPLRPQSPYGAAKAAARHLVRVYRESYKLYALQGYLYNHEGVRRGEEFVTRKITKAVARIKNALAFGKPFDPLQLGNLDAKRDWSDSEDFVDGVWRMLNQERYNVNFPVSAVPDMDLSRRNFVHSLKEYVLSSNETHTVREFVELAFKEAGIEGVWFNLWGKEKPEAEEFILARDGLATKLKVTLMEVNPSFYRPAEVHLLHGDSTLARKDLGWSPKTSFKELVAKMVRHDMEQYNG